MTEKEEKQLAYYRQLLKVYVLGNLMLEQCDSFTQSNPLAVRELKRHTNSYIKFLERNLSTPLEQLYNTEEDIFQMLQEAYNIILSINIEDIPKIAAKYLEDKDK